MEKLFRHDIDDLGAFYHFSDEELKVLDNVDKAVEELSVSEMECYLDHKVNVEGPRIAKKYGLQRIPIKKEYGGLGMAPLVSALAKMRCGQIGLGFSSYLNVQLFLTELTLQRWGSDEQKSKYLKPAVNGDSILAFGLTEPEVGSNPASMKTTFESKGGKYVINGSKYLITNGQRADHAIVFAREKGNTEPNGGITAFLVDTKSAGFSVALELREKIGLFTSDTAMLEFKDLEVSEEDIIGPKGKGLPVAYSALLNGRVGIASGCVGIIEGCMSAVIERAKERVQFGKPIGKHQLIQKHIAEIRQNLEMARWPTYVAAMKKAEYEKDPSNKQLLEETDLRASLAKKIASRLAFDSADHAVQIFGGFGYSLLSPVGRLFCDSRVTRIYEGSDEIQELKIASIMLGKGFEAFE